MYKILSLTFGVLPWPRFRLYKTSGSPVNSLSNIFPESSPGSLHSCELLHIQAMIVLSALGLAANILQFLEFTTKLIVGTCEVFSSADGTTLEHAHLSLVQAHIASLSERLEFNSSLNNSMNKPEKELVALAKKCKE